MPVGVSLVIVVFFMCFTVGKMPVPQFLQHCSVYDDPVFNCDHQVVCGSTKMLADARAVIGNESNFHLSDTSKRVEVFFALLNDSASGGEHKE
jgi:hypothetical protein